MRTLFVWTIFLIATKIYAQEDTSQKKDENTSSTLSFKTAGTYLTVSFGENTLFYPQSTGLLSVSFPYSSTNNSGTSQKVFNSSVSSPFSKPSKTFGADFQIGAKSHFFDIDIGGGSILNFYFSLGYGLDIGSERLTNNGLRIKPSINIGFYEFVRPIGSFDNQGKEINVLGEEIDSTFYTRVGAHGSWRTYNSKYINVGYQQHDFSMNPKIAFEYHPFRNLFFIELSLSYLLPFSEEAKIRLEQTDGGRANIINERFALDTKDLTTTFDGNQITNTPFKFSGLQVGLKIGF